MNICSDSLCITMADGISNGKDLNRFKVVELKEWLRKRGVKTSGKKKVDLIRRYVVATYLHKQFSTLHVILTVSKNV